MTARSGQPLPPLPIALVGFFASAALGCGMTSSARSPYEIIAHDQSREIAPAVPNVTQYEWSIARNRLARLRRGQPERPYVERVRLAINDPRTGREPYAVVQDGELIGLATVTEDLDPDYRHAALDLSLATSAHGHGLGGETLRVLARHLFAERGHHRLTIDPAANNARAIRAYERVGFRPVGVMRLYERGFDGTWHDGLLMDLLAADFEG